MAGKAAKEKIPQTCQLQRAFIRLKMHRFLVRGSGYLEKSADLSKDKELAPSNGTTSHIYYVKNCADYNLSRVCYFPPRRPGRFATCFPAFNSIKHEQRASRNRNDHFPLRLARLRPKMAPTYKRGVEIRVHKENIGRTGRLPTIVEL